jgi:hypothetical protein
MASGAAGHARINREAQAAGRRRYGCVPRRHQIEPIADAQWGPGILSSALPIDGFLLAQLGSKLGEAPQQRFGKSRGGGILGVLEERPQSAWLLGDTGCTAFEKVRDQKIGTFRRRVQKKRKQSPVYAIVII